MKNQRLTLSLSLFILFLIWNAGIYLEWVLDIFPSLAYLFPIAKQSYGIVCHQQNVKLIGEGALHSLVCSRCAGIYLGLLSSSLIYIFIIIGNVRSNKILFLSAVPLFMDVILYSIGVYNYSKTIAFITGWLLGSVGFIYLYSPLSTLFSNKDG